MLVYGELLKELENQTTIVDYDEATFTYKKLMIKLAFEDLLT